MSYQRSSLTTQYSLYSVKNHGIPEETIEAVISASRVFFSLPEEEKLKVGGVLVVFVFLIANAVRDILIRIVLMGISLQLDIRKSSGFKGYQPLLSSNNDPENMGDMHEGYEVGWETLDPTSNDPKGSNHGVMAGANVWPNELPEFREAVLKY